MSPSWRHSTGELMKLTGPTIFGMIAMFCCSYGALADDSAQPQISIALTPAIIMVRGRPGQSTTQTLTIVNHTGNEVRFKLATEDVVVKDGKRSFSAAGL